MISSAAAIMVAVFLGFATEVDVVVKMLGVGMAVAILLDATVVRMVLVPATMSLLGRWNWWLPPAGSTGCCPACAPRSPTRTWATRAPTRPPRPPTSAEPDRRPLERNERDDDHRHRPTGRSRSGCPVRPPPTRGRST